MADRSGNVTAYDASSLYDAHLYWWSTKDESNNRSLVEFQLKARHHAIDARVYGSVSFNGGSWSDNEYLSSSSSSWEESLICSGSTYVAHNSDGTLGDINISATIAYNLWSGSEGYVGSRNCSTSVTFATIPRGSSVTSVSDVNTGSNPTVTWTSNSSAFRFGIKFVCGDEASAEQSIAASSTLSRSYSGYTIPVGWAAQFTTSKAKTATCYLYTYDSGGTKIATFSKDFTITCVGTPTISSLSSARTDSGGWYSSGDIVQAISSVRISVTTSAYQGSTVKTAELLYDNKRIGDLVTVSNNSAVFNINADWYGNRTYTIKITDARTNTATSTITIKSWKYSAPSLSASYSMSGSTLSVSAGCVISSPTDTTSASSTTKSNAATISGTATDTSVSPVVVYSLSATGGATITGSCTKELTATGLDITHTYLISLQLQDTAGSDYKAVRTMSTGVVCISRLAGGTGVAFFDEATSNDSGRVRINGDLMADDTSVYGKLSVYNSSNVEKVAIDPNNDGIGDFDYVVDQGTETTTTTYSSDHYHTVDWTWRKWKSGIAECWGKITATYMRNTIVSGFSEYSTPAITYPTNLFSATPVSIQMSGRISGTGDYPTWIVSPTIGSTTAAYASVLSTYYSSTGNSFIFYISVKGRWK